nr:hypothetical protein [Tanacetum cinerariifolium]
GHAARDAGGPVNKHGVAGLQASPEAQGHGRPDNGIGQGRGRGIVEAGGQLDQAAPVNAGALGQGTTAAHGVNAGAVGQRAHGVTADEAGRRLGIGGAVGGVMRAFGLAAVQVFEGGGRDGEQQLVGVLHEGLGDVGVLRQVPGRIQNGGFHDQ